MSDVVYALHSNTSTNRTKKPTQTTKSKDLIEKIILKKEQFL